MSSPTLSCSITRTLAEVSATTDYEFTVDPSAASVILPADVYTLIKFPDAWDNSGSSGVVDFDNSLCSSATSPSISCTKSNNDMKASDIVSSVQSTPFSFQITNIKNPGSLMSNSQVYMEFYDGLHREIGNCPITIDGSTTTPISNLDFDIVEFISNENYIPVGIGESGKGVLKFTLT